MDPGRAVTADIGFLVEDIDGPMNELSRRALLTVFGPRNIEGMPRTAQIRDPSGNHIRLYQG